MVGGPTVVENSVEISSPSIRRDRSAVETRNSQLQPELQSWRASGCSSCFGRVVASSRRLPTQEKLISGNNLRCRKSRRCLKKFSCISSCDVLPTVTSVAASSSDKHATAHTIKHRGESFNGTRNRKAPLLTSAGSLMHKNLRRGLGGFLREKATTNTNQRSPKSRKSSESSFRTGNWCLMRPTLVKSDNMISSNALSRASSALQMSTSGQSRDRDPSRSSTDSCELSLMSMCNEEILSRRQVGNLERSNFYDLESGSVDSGERSSASALWMNPGRSSSTRRSLATWDRLITSSSSFSGRSNSRTMRMPFLFGIAHRARSLEVMSSPSSYMSSPEVHLSNPDLLRSYASTHQSPYLSQTASSPDYHLHSSSDTPVFRSFRQFPLQSFDEGEECFTYGGFTEHVFMWEANLLFGGIPVQDQYRDLRLDIDSMSYEDLLALEESIGNVCTGLQKDTILRCLQKKKYLTNSNLIPTQEVSELKCSICQVDFEDGNELGTLKCGHNHHFQCIEQWLLQKNQCPICKASAFANCEA